ncbi:hypothetical protein LLG96_10185 [bacterium]|nr:hypothetical protein [bacterium]
MDTMADHDTPNYAAGQCVHVPLVRRIGAYIAASLAVDSLVLYLGYPVLMQGNHRYSETLYFIAPILLLGALLVKWQREMARGKRPWFVAVKPYIFMGILLVVTVLPVVWTFLHRPVKPRGSLSFIKIYEFRWFFMLYLSLWWCDGFDLKINQIISGILSWRLYEVIYVYFGTVTMAMATRPDTIMGAVLGIFHHTVKVWLGILIFDEAGMGAVAIVLYVVLSLVIQYLNRIFAKPLRTV